jgi:hypothetical protein
MAIVLVITRPDKPELLTEVPVVGKMVFGQSVYCDVLLADKLVANMQFQVHTVTSGQLLITSLDKKREIFINKSRVKISPLKINDVLEIGPFNISIDTAKLTLAEKEGIDMEYVEYC